MAGTVADRSFHSRKEDTPLEKEDGFSSGSLNVFYHEKSDNFEAHHILSKMHDRVINSLALRYASGVWGVMS